MTIRVPFTYTANVVKPNCRKNTPVLIQDCITVNIKEFDSLPVALRAEGVDYLWDNKSLWTIDYYSYMEDNKRISIIVNSTTVKENTENYGKNHKWSSSSTEAPFFSFWRKAKWAFEDGEVVLTKDEAIKSNKTYVNDNRDEVVKQIKDIAKDMIFVNGIVYKKTAEPRYYAICFGLGKNHGGTSLSISNSFNPNIHMHSYFTALQFEEAKKYTIDFATRRGDDKSIPRIGEEKIEVLIPEAVKLKIKKTKLKY